MQRRDTRLSFIDLFAGAGGLSEGFIRSGFQGVAHIEMNSNAAATLETRCAYHYLMASNNEADRSLYFDYEKGLLSREEFLSNIPEKITEGVINEEMSEQTIKGIFARIDSIMNKNRINDIDVIIGGPPCQAYSLVGRAQSSHMKTPMNDDPRNELYKMYTRFLKKYQPKMFVFENVAGIKSARGGEAFKNLQAHLKRVGYEIVCKEQCATSFGVLQNRKRVIIIGWKKGTLYYYPEFENKISDAYVVDLLSDLPKLTRGEEKKEYSVPFNQASDYVKDNGIREPYDVLTHHVSRKNKEQDVKIYRKAIEKWNYGHERLKYDELPEELKTHKNRKSFSDRFKVVEGDTHFCHTVLAHLSKDGHYFIHPDIEQCRSISVREAARLQTFPDNYFFEGTRTAQFVQIGNAVPPLMAYGIAEKIREELL